MHRKEGRWACDVGISRRSIQITPHHTTRGEGWGIFLSFHLKCPNYRHRTQYTISINLIYPSIPPDPSHEIIPSSQIHQSYLNRHGIDGAAYLFRTQTRKKEKHAISDCNTSYHIISPSGSPTSLPSTTSPGHTPAARVPPTARHRHSFWRRRKSHLERA